MQVTEKSNTFLHSKLPIDKDENILAVYKHHWFAYASNWLIGLVLIIIILVLAILSVSTASLSLEAHKTAILAGAGLLCIIIGLGTCVPVYLLSQEQLVLTEESLLQVLQPSLFASKVDSVGLARIDDVSVRQNFMGTMFGFGHMTIETPGEQDNFEFFVIPLPHEAAREITKAHENFEAALNAGRLPTTMGVDPLAAAPKIDPAQYQQFLQYQQMVAQQQTQQAQQPTTPISAQVEPATVETNDQTGNSAPPVQSASDTTADTEQPVDS